MATLKNIHKLEDLLSREDRQKLDHGASLHKRHSRIAFKVKSIEDDKIIIRTTQGKNSAENYADKKRLIKRTREMFGRFIPDKEIIVHATPYKNPPPDDVTPEWVQKHMLAQGVKIVDLVDQTGLHKTTLSTLINGNRPMSQPVKAMFYYFFEGKETAAGKRELSSATDNS